MVAMVVAPGLPAVVVGRGGPITGAVVVVAAGVVVVAAVDVVVAGTVEGPEVPPVETLADPPHPASTRADAKGTTSDR
jgi:hypothetical protein